MKKIKNKRKIRKYNPSINLVLDSQKSNNIILINKSKNLNGLSIKNTNDKIKKTDNESNPIIKKTKNIIKMNDYELNVSSYENALKYDKRTFFNYYWSIIKVQNILLFAIIPSNDYNSQNIKICLLLFSIAQYYTVNALFFNESVIHSIYDQKGDYNIIYQLQQIFYSSIISFTVNTIIRYFSLSEKKIIELKNSRKDKNYKNKEKKFINCLNIKFILFFIISFIFLIFFWY